MTGTTSDTGTASPGARVESLPRILLTSLPTPLEPLPRLADGLGVNLWIKRDDLTGLALGGNKVRKLEFLLGHAASERCDAVITTGGSQSNHARLTAAACCKLGLRCHLVLDRGQHPENGNLLLDELFGATVELVDDSNPEVAARRMREIAKEIERSGGRPYVIPRGGSVREGAVGYLNMVGELAVQLEQVGMAPDSLYLGTGSGGTHSGVMAGRSAYGQSWLVQGVSVSHPKRHQEEKILALSNQVLQWLELDAVVDRADVVVDEGYVGDGYGHPTDATWAAVTSVARQEGIVLDPVYTGKAMAGLIDHIRTGRVPKGSTVIFLHTGGAPALFGYAGEAAGHL